MSWPMTALQRPPAPVWMGSCSILDDLDTDAIISDNRNAAQQLNISGTPAFIVGDTLIPGAVSLEEMQELVKAAREAQQG